MTDTDWLVKIEDRCRELAVAHAAIVDLTRRRREAFANTDYEFALCLQNEIDDAYRDVDQAKQRILAAAVNDVPQLVAEIHRLREGKLS